MQAGLYNHLFELSGTRVISFYTSNWKLWICLHTAFFFYHLLLLVGLQFWLLNMATIEICGRSEKHFHTNPTLWIVPELILVISYWKSHSKIWTLLETETIFLAGFAPIIADNACGSHFVILWKLKKPNLKKMWPRYTFIQNYHMSRFQANT